MLAILLALLVGLPEIRVIRAQFAKAIALLIEIYHLYQRVVELVALMDIVRWKQSNHNV